MKKRSDLLRLHHQQMLLTAKRVKLVETIKESGNVVVVVVVVDGVSLSLNPRDMAVFSYSVYKH